MVKKSMRLLLILMMITIYLSGISACSKKHEHAFKDGWVCDETYHWRIATCGDVDIGLKGLHNFVDGVCTLCGYEDPNYKPPVKPSEDPELPDDTEEPKEDPELPDDDPGSAERPKPPEDGNGDDPLDPDDDDVDVDVDDNLYESYFYPDDEYKWGSSTTDNGLKYTELSDETGLVVGYAVSTSKEKSSKSEITIPAEYNNQPVIMVDNDGFKECTSLSKITLPQGMLFIGEGAFNGCTSLSGVTIPSSLWLISKEAFYGCRSLSVIDLQKVREIRYAAFYGCSFTKLTIPDSVRTIASQAFYGCSRLTEITIGKGVKKVGGLAFYNCTNLKKVNVSDLESWCNIDFTYGNSNPLNCRGGLYMNNVLVTKLVIPEGRGVKKYSFYGCSSIEEVTISSSTGRIGEGAFMNCSALRAVKFLEGADEIDSFAFGSCSKLTEIILPNSMKTLRTEAFYQCSNLMKVVLGKGLALMEYDVFPRLSSSAKFYYRGSAAEWQRIEKHSTWSPNAGQIEFNYNG